VFICNFPPKTEEKLGLRFEDLTSVNNQLIHASVTGFPRDSVLADKPAFDLTIQAMSGMMHITGEADGPPTKVGYAITDVLTAH
jgi:succinate---hydroxymethylglutarate CoA-transferase